MGEERERKKRCGEGMEGEEGGRERGGKGREREKGRKEERKVDLWESASGFGGRVVYY